MASTTPPVAIVSRHLSRYCSSCVTVDLPGMNPNCFLDKRFSMTRCYIMASFTKVSISLHTIDVRLIGR